MSGSRRDTSISALRVMMAVPQYPYPVVGGLERQAHELAKTLLELGLEVQAVSGRIEPEQPARETVEGVLVHRMRWSRVAWRRFATVPFSLLHVLHQRRHSYDLVHLHQISGFGLFVILACKLLGKPVLTKLPNVGDFGLPALARSRLGRVKLAIFRCTDAVVAMSKESLGELNAIGFPLSRVLCTPNGIRIRGRERAADGLRGAHGCCRVGFVGRLSAEKRVDDLLHAWKEMLPSAPVRAELEVWGDGPASDDCQRLCRELGLADSVHFRGHVESVRDRLPELDVFVLPSIAEGNSNAILEAMEAGLPIVATRVGGTAMLLGREGSAFVVPPGDRGALASRLLELVRDGDLRNQLGGAMRRRAIAHFDLEEVARTYRRAYSLLTQGRRDRVCEAGNPVVTAS